MPKWCDDWSSWIKEGHFISYIREGVRFFEYVDQRDFGHWVYDWPETIETLEESGPFKPDDFEITKGYEPDSNTNQIWQWIFGIQSEAFIYLELPTDRKRHGIPKRVAPSSSTREVAHFTEEMSPFREPSFITEHFLMRPDLVYADFEAYNPNAIDLTDVKLNILIAKLQTERIGTVIAGTLRPTYPRYRDTLEKLYNRVIPQRPLTLFPVRAPAEAASGE